MAKQDYPNFKIPAEMRTFAEKSMEQAKQAFDTFISAAQQAASTADRQAAGARSSAKEMSELAMRFAESNITSSFEFAQRLVRAQNPEEVLALQADYVKSQMATLNEQATKLGKEAAKMTGQG
jgi:phasin